MRRASKAPAGFTIIELMIAVVILGVLSAVAVMSYNIYFRRARIAEAQGLLANIKGNQETYRSEFGLYCNVSSPWPPGPLGPDGVIWGPPVGAPLPWRQLGFAPDNPRLTFQLNAEAGAPGAGCGICGGTQPPMPAGWNVDYWFFAEAHGDQDGDGNLSRFWISSATTAVQGMNEVE